MPTLCVEPRMIIEGKSEGVDTVTVDYRDENGNIVTGTVDDKAAITALL